MNEKNLAGLHLAERTGISASQIYNWLNDRQTSITEGQLTALQAALSDNPIQQAELVRAHLLDEKFGLHHEMVTIDIISEGLLHDAPKGSSKGERALRILAEERISNRDLNEMLIDLARLLRPEKAP